MTSKIILGCPVKDLGLDDNMKLTEEQFEWFRSHVFYIGDLPFFGTVVEEWDKFKIGLELSKSDLLYIERKLLEETKEMLGLSVSLKFNLIGVNTNDYNNL